MLRAILNRSWRQYPSRHQLYGHLSPITKTIQGRGTKHAGNCWRSKDELISDVLLWTPTYGQAKAGRPARTYIQQLSEDAGCNPEDRPEVMNNREKWRERVRDIRAGGTTWWRWWWWWWWLYCKCSKRVTQGLRGRGSWWPNINCNILTPTLMAVNVVSFSFSRCSIWGPEAHSAGWWLSLLHLISNFPGPQLIRAPRPLLPDVAFLTTSRL